MLQLFYHNNLFKILFLLFLKKYLGIFLIKCKQVKKKNWEKLPQQCHLEAAFLVWFIVFKPETQYSGEKYKCLFPLIRKT